MNGVVTSKQMRNMDQIENVSMIAVLIWRSFPWLFLLGIAIVETYKIVSFKKKNGSVIWKPKCNVPRVIALWITPIFVISIVFAFSLLSKSVSYISLLVVLLILTPMFSSILKKIYFGIYEDRIVGDQFVSDWREIEDLIFDEDRIRIIDKTRGAIEFPMDIEVIKKIRSRIEAVYARESAQK